MSPNLPFITTDSKLAAALISKGLRLQHSRHTRSGKGYFTFHGAESLQNAIELYWKDGLLLNSRTLLCVYESLRDTSNDKVR